jgi:hypothetical protein
MMGILSNEAVAKPFRSTPPPARLLQRRCACGGTPGPSGECAACRKKRLLQRRAVGKEPVGSVPSIVHDVLRSPGAPLDAETRAFMEPRFSHDFSRVRVHTDSRAAESARAVGALAYTVGRNVVFGAGQYTPTTGSGRRLLAHELTHVVQQGSSCTMPTESQPQVEPFADGEYRIAVAPNAARETAPLEQEADSIADRVVADPPPTPALVDPHASITSGVQPQIQRVRVPLPRSVLLCGKAVTHVDVEPPRWRPLEPCLPPTVLVNRINIVGRDLSVPTPGKGPQVFNLHIGYYRDPATGRLCGIADDSKRCVAPRCVFLGCFPTLREVLDEIVDFLKKALIVLGIVALAILIALIIRLLGPILAPAMLLAEGESGLEPAVTGGLATSAGSKAVPEAEV